MIEGLKPYAEYKESGQEWLGGVPLHWDVRRTKLILREVDSRSTTGKEQLLRVSQYTGVTQRKAADGADAPDTRAASLVGYKRVSVNDLVINIMLAWNGSMGVSRFDGIASPAYCVYRLNKGAQPWYFHQLFRLPLYKGRIKTVSTGVIESRLRLYSDDLGRIEAILPPPDEQAAIVRFLDHANRKIDGFIRAKRKLIGLLNEQKQAITHRAVTRGLHPDVPLKPSGIPWLGDIPDHWKLRRVRTCILDSRAGIWGTDPAPSNKSDQIVCVRVADFDMQFLTVGIKKLTLRAVAESARTPRMLQRGDILLEKSGGGEAEPIGRVVLFNLEMPAISSNFIVRIRVDRAVVHPEFLLQVLAIMQKTRRNVPFIKQTTGIQNLNEKTYCSLPIGVPPLKEQTELIAALSHAVDPINTAIARTEREIALMQEYRTRLTADLVTGKLDVREAAAKLPNQPAAPDAEPTPDETLEEIETKDLP